MSVSLTNRAVEEIKKVRGEQNLPAETPLRIGVKGGGCSGFSYFMGFEPNVRDDDQAVQIDGVKVVVDAKSASYLDEVELDFNEDIMNRGFVFKNPNAKGTCHCGHSFCP